VLLDGAIMTADCLSREKRDGTLGLLFLTKLRGHDIVGGKFISRTGQTGYFLLAAMPALGFTMFLGGVRGRDFLYMALALMNALFFSAACGMFVSAIAKRERRVLLGAVFFVLGMSVVLPASGWLLSIARGNVTIAPPFLLPSPAGAFWHALVLNDPLRKPGYGFWQALGCSHLIAWVLLASAGAFLSRTWREPMLVFRSKLKLKPAAARVRLRNWSEPMTMLWIGGRRRDDGWALWPVLLLVAGSWIGVSLLIPKWWLGLSTYAITVSVLHLIVAFFALVQACRAPAADLQSGVLETLLTTPLGDDAYRRGRLLALKRQFFGPVLVVLAIDLGVMIAGCWKTGALNWAWLGWFVSFVFLSGKLLLDLYAICWIGVWQALKCGHVGRAIRKTILYVFLYKWLILLPVIAVLGVATQGRLFSSPAGALIAAVGYLLLLPGAVVTFCATAITELQDDLRLLALGPTSDPDASMGFGLPWLKPFRDRFGVARRRARQPR
jgi:hypothetical protein